MSAAQIDVLLDLWAASLLKHGDKPPFAHHQHLYRTIDSTPLGDIKWQSFSVRYTGEIPATNPPPWMQQSYDTWFRDPRAVTHRILGNPSFASEIDLQPFREYSTEGDIRQFQDFMSGDWAWDQADIISEDASTLGSTFVPIILGSDKTTVSVGTGNNEFYPLYLSVGNVRNNVRRAHRDALVLIGFLAIPKTTKEHAGDTAFRKFRRQLFHSSLATILNPLKPAMTRPEVVIFGDGHFRRVIYGLGPYIADYEEQALLTCIVRGWCPRCQATRGNLDADARTRCREFHEALFEESTLQVLWEEYGIVGDLVPFTNDFPRADIHRLIVPDLLHQLIKGCFKDHLVDWVERWLKKRYSKCEAEQILDDIDRRIAAVAPFSGLRRFPQGRGFKQWTGNDSKALMKVYIAAIEGYVPTDISLEQIEDALRRFHLYREAFKTGDDPIVTTFSLPRQHSAKHYPALIRLFGAPNGLCSSITECKHIKAVKEPYRQSSKYEALGQMLLTNQRLDKIAASRIDFLSRGMLEGTSLAFPSESSQTLASATVGDAAAEEQPQTASVQADNEETIVDNRPTDLSAHIELSRTPQRNRARTLPALAEELSMPNLPDLVLIAFFSTRSIQTTPVTQVKSHLLVALILKVAYIHLTRLPHSFYAPSDLSASVGPRFDCVFVGTNSDNPDDTGMQAYDIACVLTFFSFTFRGIAYPCAVIWWFDKIGDQPDEDTWNEVPRELKPYHSYDAFRAFYVNKYADHHAFEIAG
ncbi:hypothetical protein BU15DRAFT_89804 [Melanogaster broomeanus]|nr:hypothetical protein BU15DRAFT_89804 [Melanogaster broomeanus]